MSWPPSPNNTQANTTPNPNAQHPEWRIIEKALTASVEEQRRARRWSVFFKLLTFGYLVLLLFTVSRCQSDTSLPMGRVKPVTSSEHLAVIDVQGVISSDSQANAHDISESLKDAFEDDNAKAIALNINSPGGSPVQSDEIWQTITDYKEQYPDKKVYAVIGDIGASGAYYIASAADEIWVNPSSLVGSIGVIMPNYGVSGALEKLGIEDRTLTSGKYKNILSPTKPLNADEQAHVQGLLAVTHQNFIDAVKAGRGARLKDPEANNTFSGLFWTGKQSLALGLADKTGSINSLAKSLDLKTIDYTYEDPINSLFKNFGVSVGMGIGQAMGLSVNADAPTLK